MRVNVQGQGSGAIELFQNIETKEYLGFRCTNKKAANFQKKDFKKISHEEIIMRLL